MEEWLKQRRPKLDREPKNGEEMSLSRVGKDLYEKVRTLDSGRGIGVEQTSWNLEIVGSNRACLIICVLC